MELTAENVQTVLMDCFLTDEEVVHLSLEGANTSKVEEVVEAGHLIRVEGVVGNFGFHPERLAEHYDDVKSMLDQLPDNFFLVSDEHPNGGGGWSFLNACMRDDDQQWGEHRDIEGLLVLGIGLNLAKMLMPKEVWGILPGGMPYFVVGDFRKDVPYIDELETRLDEFAEWVGENPNA